MSGWRVTINTTITLSCAVHHKVMWASKRIAYKRHQLRCLLSIAQQDRLEVRICRNKCL